MKDEGLICSSNGDDDDMMTKAKETVREKEKEKLREIQEDKVSSEKKSSGSRWNMKYSSEYKLPSV